MGPVIEYHQISHTVIYQLRGASDGSHFNKIRKFAIFVNYRYTLKKTIYLSGLSPNKTILSIPFVNYQYTLKKTMYLSPIILSEKISVNIEFFKC